MQQYSTIITFYYYIKGLIEAMYNISSSNPITVTDLTIYGKRKVLSDDCGQVLLDRKGMYVCITGQELPVQSRGELSLSEQEDIFILINICLPASSSVVYICFWFLLQHSIFCVWLALLLSKT